MPKHTRPTAEATKADGAANGFGSLMRSAREAQELSQSAVARKAGCAVSTICDYEHGRRTPDATRLVKLGKVLKIDLARLVRAAATS